MGCRIIGSGGYLPSQIKSNHDLSLTVETSDEWIKTRTGIHQRHIAYNGELSSDMGAQAAKLAIENAKIKVKDLDLILVATTTPDQSFPSTATKIQQLLRTDNIPVFDFQAVCSGFIYGLHIAHAMMHSHKYRTILLIASEKMSSLINWEDRSTCVLFGDGAGAVILRQDDSEFGIVDSKIYADGSKIDILRTPIFEDCESNFIKMNGKEVFRQAVEKMTDSVKEILNSNQIDVSRIKYFIPHQANIRIINNMMTKLNLTEDQVIITIDQHANCSAASIPLALYEMQKTKNILPGDLVLMTAFGAGSTWGSVLIKW